jgi:hypothetical protein
VIGQGFPKEFSEMIMMGLKPKVMKLLKFSTCWMH